MADNGLSSVYQEFIKEMLTKSTDIDDISASTGNGFANTY